MRWIVFSTALLAGLGACQKAIAIAYDAIAPEKRAAYERVLAAFTPDTAGDGVSERDHSVRAAREAYLVALDGYFQTLLEASRKDEAKELLAFINQQARRYAAALERWFEARFAQQSRDLVEIANTYSVFRFYLYEGPGRTDRYYEIAARVIFTLYSLFDLPPRIQRRVKVRAETLLADAPYREEIVLAFMEAWRWNRMEEVFALRRRLSEKLGIDDLYRCPREGDEHGIHDFAAVSDWIEYAVLIERENPETAVKLRCLITYSARRLDSVDYRRLWAKARMAATIKDRHEARAMLIAFAALDQGEDNIDLCVRVLDDDEERRKGSSR